MAFLQVIWDLDDDPKGNVRHMADHGISKAEVLMVLAAPETHEESGSSGRPAVIGTTSTGGTILVVYEQVDQDTVYPVTAYDLED